MHYTCKNKQKLYTRLPGSACGLLFDLIRPIRSRIMEIMSC